MTVKRRCGGFVSVEAFNIFEHGGDVESCGDLSWEDLLSDCQSEAWVVVPEVPDVTDVLVSPSSVVTELGGGFSGGSEWNFVKRCFD